MTESLLIYITVYITGVAGAYPQTIIGKLLINEKSYAIVYKDWSARWQPKEHI